MFHVLVKGNKIRAEEYEPEYRYSTYTRGGGYWSGSWVLIKACLGETPDYRLTIYETKSVAEKEAESYNKLGYHEVELVKAIPLFQLEDYLQGLK